MGTLFDVTLCRADVIGAMVMSGQFSAQAQKPALGYLYQVRYALLLLIEAGIEDPRRTNLS